MKTQQLPESLILALEEALRTQQVSQERTDVWKEMQIKIVEIWEQYAAKDIAEFENNKLSLNEIISATSVMFALFLTEQAQSPSNALELSDQFLTAFFNAFKGFLKERMKPPE